jgi:molybdopterin-guanine dinucleotide biosynthesis protein
MSNDKANEFYKDLKKLAQGGESLLNEFIQKWLNQEELTRLVGNNSNLTGEIIKRLQKYQDFVTTALKIPTKDDLANVAKLVIQSEDKLELIEEQFQKLQNSLGNNCAEKAQVLADTLDKLNEKKVECLSHRLREIEPEKEIHTKKSSSSKEAKLAFLKDQLQIKLNESTSKMIENVLNQEAPLTALKRRLKNRG